MISSAGQPEEQPDLKKPTALRGAVGVWDRESGDRIKGCGLEHNQCHSLYLFPVLLLSNPRKRGSTETRDVLLPRSPAFQQELVKNRPTMTRLGVICEG